jgi:PmbA protein
MHTADPISGDFSVGVEGLRIANGKLAQPVHGVTISGNLVDLFKSIESVADDLRFLGNIGSPTVSIGQLSISG